MLAFRLLYSGTVRSYTVHIYECTVCTAHAWLHAGAVKADTGTGLLLHEAFQPSKLFPSANLSVKNGVFWQHSDSICREEYILRLLFLIYFFLFAFISMLFCSWPLFLLFRFFFLSFSISHFSKFGNVIDSKEFYGIKRREKKANVVFINYTTCLWYVQLMYDGRGYQSTKCIWNLLVTLHKVDMLPFFSMISKYLRCEWQFYLML